MVFNSNVFVGFFLAFLLGYHLVRKSLRMRNLLIVVASYAFYGWWDARFLVLLAASSCVDFFVSRSMGRSTDPVHRRRLLWLSVGTNLGILGFFKYFGFFVESLVAGLRALGYEGSVTTLEIVLPVGISFYTFQSLSYTVDVYRRRLEPTNDIVAFLAYVSFFPQLVAGPIERAKHLLPQFQSTRTITSPMVEEGVWLIIWGMFKKVVIADNLAPLVEMVFDAQGVGGPIIVLGAIAFGLQIYCDFSGYSDIARGLARVLGFDLMVNFNLPYIATSLREFWRRWHISLSTWLRDYLYIPLGGSRCGATRNGLNLFITMLLGGLWHGAAWNFVLWGAWHGAILAMERALRSERESVSRTATVLHWAVTMIVVFFGWLMFRAHSLDQIIELTVGVWSLELPHWTASYVINVVVFSVPLLLIQCWQWRASDLLVVMKTDRCKRADTAGAVAVWDPSVSGIAEPRRSSIFNSDTHGNREPSINPQSSRKLFGSSGFRRRCWLMICCVVRGAGIVGALPDPLPILDMDRTILLHQAKASTGKHDAEIVLIGDSSCLMDISTTGLAEQLGRKVLNLGTLSYLDITDFALILEHYFAVGQCASGDGRACRASGLASSFRIRALPRERTGRVLFRARDVFRRRQFFEVHLPRRIRNLSGSCVGENGSRSIGRSGS